MNDPMKNQEATVPSTDTDTQRGLFPELTELMRAAVADADLHSFEIPSLDLYIDQILTLVSEKNETAGARYRENVLTKTMVNNYSKEGLISSIKVEKYRFHLGCQTDFAGRLRRGLQRLRAGGEL